MKIDEILEMEYPQKLAHDIILGIADPITNISSSLSRSHLQAYAFKFYFDPLFDYPFGGVEIHNTRALMEFISSEYDGIRPTISPEEMAIWLKEFHTKLAQALHNGEAVLDMVPE